jgi:hypothetical protein
MLAITITISLAFYPHMGRIKERGYGGQIKNDKENSEVGS